VVTTPRRAAGSPVVSSWLRLLRCTKDNKHQIAVLLRGGMLPQASGSPAKRRAPRALLRRRLPLMRKRAALLTHIPQTNSQYNLPEIGKKLASQANRDGVADRCAAPAVQTRSEVDLALISHYDQLRNAGALTLGTTAKQHDAQTLSRRPSVPGIGTILRLVILAESPDIARFPRVQDCVAYCRLVKCAKASAGKRSGTAGTQIGNAYLQWACSEAAVLCLRDHPAGQQDWASLEKTQGPGKA
jgi:transposase IS116/IS110/IS902 family protein